MESIFIQQTFEAPCEEVFAQVCDHANFGRLTGADIRRIRDAEGDDPNGVGSVRQIRSFPVPAFEETVLVYEPGKRMEYTVSRGSPIHKHRGTLLFLPAGEGCRLDYTIVFEPRLGVPGLGKVLKLAIRRPIEAGLRKLARHYQTP